MKIDAIDIIQTRNMAVPRKGKKRLPLPEQGVSTLIQVTAITDGGKRVTGLGEIRAMTFLTGETPANGYGFARRLGRALMGAELPEGLTGWDNAAATHALVTETTKSVKGIATENALDDRMHPAVRFGFDSALLEALANAAAVSVAGLLGGTPAPVRRNVFARSFAKPSRLLNALLTNNKPNGWLRGSYAKDGPALASVVGAISAATNGREDDMKGIWFDIKGRWRPEDLQMMLEGLAGTSAVRNSSLELMLEQPFPGHATAWYAKALELIGDVDGDLGGRITMMLEDGLTSAEALEPMAALMPHVDLKITPQKCGSFHALNAMLARADALGFKGRVYLGNAGMNTELNSLVLASLVQVLDRDILFSADHKREDDSKIRQVHPQLSPDEEDTRLLHLPEGSGWGTRLCKSGLEKRMRKSDFLRSASVSPDVDSLKTLLLMRAFDDSQLNIRQLDEDDEEEEVFETEASAEDTQEGDDGADEVEAPSDAADDSGDTDEAAENRA